VVLLHFNDGYAVRGPIFEKIIGDKISGIMLVMGGAIV